MRSVGTLTRADIADTINHQVGLSRADAAQMVESVLDHMTSALERGENVKISGFGTFLLRDKGERVGRNPDFGRHGRRAARDSVVGRERHGVEA